MSTERIHHPYSPSKLQSLEACPKYHSAFTDSVAAQTGTRQHDVAERGIDDARLPDYKVMAVAECMKFVDERIAQYPGCTVLREDYLPIDDEVISARIGKESRLIGGADPDPEVVECDRYRLFKGTTAGYLDLGIVSADGKSAEVIDYKFGKVGVEPAENNLQGMAYMLGLRKRFPGIEECTVYFLMPHRDEITFHRFSGDDFKEAYVRIRTVVQRAVAANEHEDDFSTATPNTGACVFCSLIGRCPKVAEVALRLGQKYQPLDFPDSISTSVFTDPVQIGRGLRLSQIVKTWAEAYRTQATAKTIDDATFVPAGYDLVSMSKRSVVKAKELGELAKTFLPEEHREKVEALYELGIGAVEELISTAAARGSKEKTVDEFGARAVEQGLLEVGAPYAFLRQQSKPKEKKKQTKTT